VTLNARCHENYKDVQHFSKQLIVGLVLSKLLGVTNE
jgi:hypothetical protein